MPLPRFGAATSISRIFLLTFSPTKINVSSSQDMAYEIGTNALGFRGDKGLVQKKGKYVVVWKKVGGTWKAAADIFKINSDGPALVVNSLIACQLSTLFRGRRRVGA